jgi:hypothetical protein
VVEPPRFLDGELDYLLRTGGETNLTADRLFAPADDELNGGAYLAKLDAKVVEDLGGDAITLPDKAQEQVLGAYVVVVESLRFLLGKR